MATEHEETNGQATHAPRGNGSDRIEYVSISQETRKAAMVADGALDDPPAARRFLQKMNTEIDNLTQLVHELLELSRIGRGAGKVPERATYGVEITGARRQVDRFIECPPRALEIVHGDAHQTEIVEPIMRRVFQCHAI